MSRFARKLRRKNIEGGVPQNYCRKCNVYMKEKKGYGIYVCPKCGRTKLKLRRI